METLSVALVRSLRQRQQRGLPEAVRKKVLFHIADTVGISLAACRSAPVVAQALAGLGSGCGPGEGRIFGSDLRLPPAYAAFANSALAHALDYDDIHDMGRIHPTTVNLPAAMAAADLSMSGDCDLVTAVAMGNEFMCRLGRTLDVRGTGPGSDWFLTQLFGYLSACLSAGLVLGLEDAQLVAALGIAYMQVAGGKEPAFGTGSMARAVYPAFAAMGGVQAALLARAGLTAPTSVLDGAAGLFRIYLGAELNEQQRQSLLATDDWHFAETELKPYPSCRLSHPYVGAALSLRPRIAGQAVAEIHIGVNASAAKLCRPLAERQQPRTLQDAKYSVPFMTAFALAHGRVNLQNLSEAVLADPEVQALAQRTVMVESQPDSAGLPLGDVTVVTTRGTYAEHEYKVPPVTPAEALVKFQQCCDFAGVGDWAKPLWKRLFEAGDCTVLRELPPVPGWLTASS